MNFIYFFRFKQVMYIEAIRLVLQQLSGLLGPSGAVLQQTLYFMLEKYASV